MTTIMVMMMMMMMMINKMFEEGSNQRSYKDPVHTAGQFLE